MLSTPDVLVICHCTVAGENEELLGVDESPLTQLSWIAIDVSENEVSDQSFNTYRASTTFLLCANRRQFEHPLEHPYL